MHYTQNTSRKAPRKAPTDDPHFTITVAHGGRVHIRRWVEVEHRPWTVAYLMDVPPDMPPRVAEVRVFPTERVSPRDLGTWSGSDRIPRGGIRSGILGKVRTREALRALHRELGELISEINVELPGATNWRTEKEPSPPRGRPPVSEETLARVSRLYVDAISKGVNPLPYIAECLGDVKITTVRGWVHRARNGKRKFLTAASKKGVLGGLETQLVEQVIGPRTSRPRRHSAEASRR